MPSDLPNRSNAKAHPPTWLSAVVASVGLHAATVVALPALATRLKQPARVTTVELDFVPVPAIPLQQPSFEPEPEPERAPPAPVPMPIARVRTSRPLPTPRSAPETPPPEASPPASKPKVPEPEAPAPVEVVGIDPDTATEGELALPAGDTLLGAPETDSSISPRQGISTLTTSNSGALTKGNSSGQPTGPATFLPVGPEQIRQMPSILKEIQVAYPERARILEIEGTVLLSVGVDENGLTREVRVLRGIGYGLDEAATQALRDFRWRPALGHDGRPVPVRLTYSYRFRVPR